MKNFRPIPRNAPERRPFRRAFGLLVEAFHRSLERRERALRIRGRLCAGQGDDDRKSESVPIDHVRREERWTVRPVTRPQPTSIQQFGLVFTA